MGTVNRQLQRWLIDEGLWPTEPVPPVEPPPEEPAP